MKMVRGPYVRRVVRGNLTCNSFKVGLHLYFPKCCKISDLRVSDIWFNNLVYEKKATWRTEVLWLESPVSLIPIHQLVKVSFSGWGITVDANFSHWVTWSTNGMVKSWCRGSLRPECQEDVCGCHVKTYISPSMSAPANAKFQSCLGQLKGLPWKHPVRNSSLYIYISFCFWDWYNDD